MQGMKRTHIKFRINWAHMLQRTWLTYLLAFFRSVWHIIFFHSASPSLFIMLFFLVVMMRLLVHFFFMRNVSYIAFTLCCIVRMQCVSNVSIWSNSMQSLKKYARTYKMFSITRFVPFASSFDVLFIRCSAAEQCVHISAVFPALNFRWI